MNFFRLFPFVVALMFFIPACDTSNDKSGSLETSGNLAVTGSSKLESLSVLALGPADGRAVVAQPDGKMHVLNVGDSVPGTKATVIQVLHDKLVVEDTIERADEPGKQVVWLFRSEKSGEKSRVLRFDPVGPDKEPLRQPVTGMVEE